MFVYDKSHMFEQLSIVGRRRAIAATWRLLTSLPCSARSEVDQGLFLLSLQARKKICVSQSWLKTRKVCSVLDISRSALRSSSIGTRSAFVVPIGKSQKRVNTTADSPPLPPAVQARSRGTETPRGAARVRFASVKSPESWILARPVVKHSIRKKLIHTLGALDFQRGFRDSNKQRFELRNGGDTLFVGPQNPTVGGRKSARVC